eukprot:13533148-Alexandrium_andersonii.AAC.1
MTPTAEGCAVLVEPERGIQDAPPAAGAIIRRPPTDLAPVQERVMPLVLLRTTTCYHVLGRTRRHWGVLRRTTTYYDVLVRTTTYWD